MNNNGIMGGSAEIVGVCRGGYALHDLTWEETPSPSKCITVHEAAYQELKKRLMKVPLLAVPDPDKPWTICTNTGDVAIGATQLPDHGKGQQPVAYGSRKLREAELSYAVHEQKALAVIHALQTRRAVSKDGRLRW